MAADLTALTGLHDGLKQGTKNCGRDTGPIEPRASKESFPHFTVKVGEIEPLREEVAVNVAEGGEGFVEIFLATLLGSIEHLKETSQVKAEVGAVLRGAILKIERKEFTFENASIFSEETEEDANE